MREKSNYDMEETWDQHVSPMMMMSEMQHHLGEMQPQDITGMAHHTSNLDGADDLRGGHPTLSHPDGSAMSSDYYTHQVSHQ